ncbi:hypothetical protein FOA52_004710 [Chlamydomonas sp. UWO 241]|nr:hypothetical protein FOA52_004710 [Chlamydomonas sp. UWO 241]
MSLTLVPLRTLGFVLCLLGCHAMCRIGETVMPRGARSGLLPAVGKFWCRLCALILGLWVTWVKEEGPGGGKGDAPPGAVAAGLISNHGSWADILIHLGRYWCSFAARDGTQDLMMIGYISSRMLQCVYVNRLKSTSASSQGVSAQIKQRMLAKASPQSDDTDRLMLLFPEGTTTNGKYLLPFKTGAFLAGVPLQPVIIKYHGTAFSPTWDTINVFRQIWLLMCQPITHITCVELAVYHPSEEEKSDPALYAENMRQYMIKYSKLKPSEASFASKMEYHRAIEAAEKAKRH